MMMTGRNGKGREGKGREEKVWELRGGRRDQVDDAALNGNKISLSVVSKENEKDVSVTENNHLL